MYKKYIVYFVKIICYNGNVTIERTPLGNTMAKSKKQAENNIRYRMFGKKSHRDIFDCGCDDYANEYFEAVEIL